MPDAFLLQRLQKKQHLIHRKNRNTEAATSEDVNCSLTWAFKNSNEFATQFKCYRDLEKNEKNLILAEFAIAYMLIDQGFKTCQEAKSHWILQNDSILKTQDPDFSNFLIETLAKPFQNLKIDRVECVFLKSLVLLTRKFVLHEPSSNPFFQLPSMETCYSKDQTLQRQCLYLSWWPILQGNFRILELNVSERWCCWWAR